MSSKELAEFLNSAEQATANCDQTKDGEFKSFPSAAMELVSEIESQFGQSAVDELIDRIGSASVNDIAARLYIHSLCDSVNTRQKLFENVIASREPNWKQDLGNNPQSPSPDYFVAAFNQVIEHKIDLPRKLMASFERRMSYSNEATSAIIRLAERIGTLECLEICNQISEQTGLPEKLASRALLATARLSCLDEQFKNVFIDRTSDANDLVSSKCLLECLLNSRPIVDTRTVLAVVKRLMSGSSDPFAGIRICLDSGNELLFAEVSNLTQEFEIHELPIDIAQRLVRTNLDNSKYCQALKASIELELAKIADPRNSLAGLVVHRNSPWYVLEIGHAGILLRKKRCQEPNWQFGVSSREKDTKGHA